jgi:hypothetical protein
MIGSRYSVKPSCYIQITSLTTPSALIEVFVNFKAGNLSLDTATDAKTQSLGYAKLINTTGDVYSFVLETTDGNDTTISKPSNIVDIEFKYLLDSTTVSADTITAYSICLEFEEDIN